MNSKEIKSIKVGGGEIVKLHHNNKTIWQKKEPYLFYDDCTGTNPYEKWENVGASGNILTYNNGRLYNNNNWVCIHPKVNLDLSKTYTIECKFNLGSYIWSCMGVYLYDSTKTTTHPFVCFANSSSRWCDLHVDGISLNTEYNLKLVIQNNKLNVYVNNSLKGTVNIPSGYPIFTFYFPAHTGTQKYFSNIMIQEGVH